MSNRSADKDLDSLRNSGEGAPSSIWRQRQDYSSEDVPSHSAELLIEWGLPLSLLHMLSRHTEDMFIVILILDEDETQYRVDPDIDG